MTQVALQVMDPVAVDMLRYIFDSWGETVQISRRELVGKMISGLVQHQYEPPELEADARYVVLELPADSNYKHDRYMYAVLNKTAARIINDTLLTLYQAEVSRWVAVGARRGLRLKQAVIAFLDAIELRSDGYELSMNWDAIRRMISRDDQRARALLMSMQANTRRYRTTLYI